jgi:4-nitrophenyl phosphatase
MSAHSPANIKAMIVDMDGVLWKDNDPIGDLPLIFERIRARGWRLCLATNNATRTVDEYVEKLKGFGVEVSREQVINSSQAAAHYLKSRYPEGGHVFVVGEQSLVKELSERGFDNHDQEVLAVVVGLDRGITYDKLRKATLLIRAGVPFIATNPDKTFPSPEGLVPGTGSLLAAIEAASEQSPVITGKPEPEMYVFAMERMGTKPEETLIVGDRLETDIAGGQNLGCPTALVLSGVTTQQEATNFLPAPDWIGKDLKDLLEYMK